MGLLALVLQQYDGIPLRRWPWSINLNSFISVISTISKATMMVPIVSAIGQLKWQWFLQPRSIGDIQAFDSASRGPFGSVALIFSQMAL